MHDDQIEHEYIVVPTTEKPSVPKWKPRFRDTNVFTGDVGTVIGKNTIPLGIGANCVALKFSGSRALAQNA